MTAQAIGAYFQELRERRGLRQEDLAELIGKSVRMLGNYERGKTVPTGEALIKMLALLHGSPEHLQALIDGKYTPDEARLLAASWVMSGGSAEQFNAEADEAARIVAAMTEAGETDLASQYLGIGRRLLQRAEVRPHAA